MAELLKIRATEEAIRRLPNELLARVDVDEETRRKVRELIGLA